MMGGMAVAEAGSDEALMRAARAGDREALETLVTRYEPRVYRFGLSLCRDREAARDVLQDTFLSMVRALPGFRGDSSLSTWLFAIAHHACTRKRRRGRSSPRSLESLEALSPADRNVLVAGTASPEAAAAAEELHRSLQAAIGALDASQREVLLLRDVEGLTAADTAKTLGLSVPAVKSRLHRARLALRQALAPGIAAGATRAAGGTAPAQSECARCREVALAFSQHVEGELSAAHCAEMEAHVAQCPMCRSACESLREVLTLCQTPAPAVPDSTKEALRHAIRACLES